MPPIQCTIWTCVRNTCKWCSIILSSNRLLKLTRWWSPLTHVLTLWFHWSVPLYWGYMWVNFQSTNQLGGYKIVGLHFVFMGTWVVVTDNVYLIHKDWMEKIQVWPLVKLRRCSRKWLSVHWVEWVRLDKWYACHGSYVYHNNWVYMFQKINGICNNITVYVNFLLELFLAKCFIYTRDMAEILLIWRKTLSNQSIIYTLKNQSQKIH